MCLVLMANPIINWSFSIFISIGSGTILAPVPFKSIDLAPVSEKKKRYPTLVKGRVSDIRYNGRQD